MAIWGASLNAQVRLVNNNSNIRVTNGIDFRVSNGSITNQNNATINNEGNIYLGLDYNQNTGANYNGSPTSWLWFEGSGNQNTISDVTLNIARLKVDNNNRLILNNQVNILEDISLSNNGSIELGTHHLVLNSGATISDYNSIENFGKV